MRRAVGVGIGACALLVLGALVARWLADEERAPRVVPTASESTAPAGARTGPAAHDPTTLEASVATPDSTPQERAAVESPVREVATTNAPGLELAGRVVDDVGRPLEHFEIALTGPGLETTRAFPRDDLPLPDGGFLLRGLGPGEWRLVASDPRAPRHSAPRVVELPAFLGTLELVVPRAGGLAGYVLDPDGVGISDAEVHLRDPDVEAGLRRPQNGLSTLGYGGPAPVARSDRAGAFRVAELPAGVHELLAVHGDFCSGLWTAFEVAPGEVRGDVELSLTRGGRVAGLVEAAEGGVEDLKVGLYPLRGEVGWSDTHTDADGRFAFEHVFPGDYIVDHLPSAPGSAQLRRNITVREGETTEVVFGRPERPVQLVGRALRGGAPVAELRVVAHRLDGHDRGEEATTAADGSFAMELGGAGRYELIASLLHTSYAYFEIDVPDTPSHEVTLELPGGRVTGRITDAEGRPVANLPVTLSRGESLPQFDWREHLRKVRTDDDGRFTVELLIPDRYGVRAPDGFQHDDPWLEGAFGRTLSAAVEVGAFETVHVDLSLPRGGRIAGVLVDSFDRPVDRARVGARDAAGREISAYPWEVESDGTGAFELGFLAPGTYTVHARLGERRVEFPAIEVEAGRTTSARLVLP